MTSDPINPSRRPLRTVLVLLVPLTCFALALLFLYLHVRSGPAQQSITIRWATGSSAADRRAAETALKLGTGEKSEPDRSVYRLRDRSRQAIRDIVTHPLVADTAHIDREGFRILLDAPTLPRILRRLLETDLTPALSLVLAAIGLAVVWLSRRELLLRIDQVRAVPQLELGLAVTLLCVGFVLFRDNGLSVDENVHYDQIARLAGGDWSLHPALTMLPGYHTIVAALVRLTGGASEVSVRFATFVLSIATVGVFHSLATIVQPRDAATRTLQFALLPILFPQFFLVYSDVTSLLFVLLMMLASLKGRYAIAGILGLAACLVRQDNIVWAAFAATLTYFRDYGWTWRPLSETLRRYWTFVATGAAFIVFVVVNNGQIAIGQDVGSHPLGPLHLANIFFLLFLSCFLFLPLWWGYRREVVTNMRGRSPWVLVLALFPIFWLGFVVDHPYNLERASFFMRNAVLIYFSSTPLHRLLFFIPVAIAAVCFAAMPIKRPWWLLFPFTVIFLLPEWLVEQRYYLIPLSLLILARPSASLPTERAQTSLFLAASIALFVMIERTWAWM